MTTRHTRSDDEAPVYHYEFIGTGPATFPSLTGLGIGLVDPGTKIAVPEPVLHVDLQAADKATRDATAQLAEWVAALETEANAPAGDTTADEEPGEPSAEPDSGDVVVTQDEEH